MNRIKIAEQVLKDSDNFEGLMPNSSDEFRMLVKNKAVESFARAEAGVKRLKIDSLLTKLYLAL
jgi:hypothetical protein